MRRRGEESLEFSRQRLVARRDCGWIVDQVGLAADAAFSRDVP